LLYYSQGRLKALEWSTGVGKRTADIVLTSGRRVECKSWLNWASRNAYTQKAMLLHLEEQIKRYLQPTRRGHLPRLVVEWDQFIPLDAERLIDRLAPRYGGRLTWERIMVQ
jgi:hypothetical protein